MKVLPEIRQESGYGCLPKKEGSQIINSLSPLSHFPRENEEVPIAEPDSSVKNLCSSINSRRTKHRKNEAIFLKKRLNMKGLKLRKNCFGSIEGNCSDDQGTTAKKSNCENCQDYKNFLPTGIHFKWTDSDSDSERLGCTCARENGQQTHAPLNKEIQAGSHDDYISARWAGDDDVISRPVICSVIDSGCDKKLSRRLSDEEGACAHTTSKIIRLTAPATVSQWRWQSNSESKQNDKDRLSEPSYFTAVDDYDRGKNSLVESGVPSSTSTKTTNSISNLTQTCQFGGGVTSNKNSGQDVFPTRIDPPGTVKESSSSHFINSRYNDPNPTSSSWRISSKRKGLIFNAPSHSISRNLLGVPLLFNFILFSTFLLCGFNYCDAEILSSLRNDHNDDFHRSEQKSNYVEFNMTSATADHLLPLPYRNDRHNHHFSGVGYDNDMTSLDASNGKIRESEREEERTGFGTREEYLRDLLSQPLDSLDKDTLIKALWDALTPAEINRIFGHRPASKSNLRSETVPNFDITLPQVSPHPNNARRRRRSVSGSASHSDKLIRLNGLGREFTMSLYPNQKLLDPFFVHLHRHQNRSEIMPHKLVERELSCFYHGSTTHVGEKEKDFERGAVALSLCGGVKGFILPKSNPEGGQQYHYVIHPLPDRLANGVPATAPPPNSPDQNQQHGHHRHHIIFRRPGTIFPNVGPQRSSSNTGKATENNQNENDDNRGKRTDPAGNNDEDDDESFDKVGTCMHHDSKPDTVTKTKYASEINDGDYYDHDNHERVGSAYATADRSDNNELDLSKRNGENRKKAIISDDSSINDLESLTEEDGGVRLVSSPRSVNDANHETVVGHGTGTNKHFRSRRRKRNAFDTETIDPFTYRPVNIAQDSYWLQFRDRGNNAHNGGLMSSAISSDVPVGYNDNRRISSQFRYDDNSGPGPVRFSASSGPSTAFQPSFWNNQGHSPSLQQRSSSLPHNLPSRPVRGSRYDEIPAGGLDDDEDTRVASSDHMTWSKGILVFESSDSAEDRNYPGKDVPFYTKNNPNKRKTKGISTSSSVVSSTSSTSSSGGNTRSFDWFGGGLSDAASSGTATSSGRPPWSSLDKNRTTSKSYSVSDSSSSATRKGRRDDGVFGDKWKSGLDSDILWADRSNEINKQSRFEDLSNVKDRPHSHLTIETAVFVDKDLYKHMQQNFPEDTQGEVTRIVLAMINAVQLLYQDPSLGHRVDFVLKRLEVLESDPPTLIRPYDIDRFLTNFCKWQKTENPASDADPLHWDHALILTGLDLYVVHQSGKISNQVVGLAPVAGMCTRSSSCTVNEGRHFESVFVVAHEIGHNLGMRHDGPQAENNCDPTSHIMSPTLGSGKITWSPCSKKYLDLFLETSQAKCLFDKAKPERWLDHNGDGRLPGERFDADRQCVLKYGRGSFHATQQPLEDVCRDLHCRREFFTWTSHPALDGTRCSAGDEMWCRAGKCVPKITGPSSSSQNSYEISSLGGHKSHNEGFSGGSNHLPGSETAAYATQKALDGGWGKWSPFTDCSSACLHSDDGTLTMGSNGVRLAARRCDSPRPENGGRQCSGPDRRYKTCSAHKICTKTPTRTTVSQYATEVCSRAGQVDTELTGRGYMSSSNDPERASSVWCETNDKNGPRSRGWSFPDGTACKIASLPKNSQTFCVAGKCQEFTCNPYSHFRLSEDDCAFTSSNDVIPNLKKNGNTNGNTNNNGNAADSWFGAGGPNGGVKINHRSGKAGWTDWEVQSECKLACLAPAKGLQLVKRQCASDDTLCTGLSLSVRLCKPDKFAVQSNGCSRLQTPFEYATKVCSKYAEKVNGLSGIGMQLSPTKDDTNRPCRIGCQDASIAYRFYMVNGEEGWFPAGTDCSRGDQDKKAYCMAGKCVDFGDDDTPLYQISSNMMGSLFQQQRNKRQAVYHIMEPLKTDPGMDESSLKELVQKFSQETGNYPSLVQKSRVSQRRSSTGNTPGSVDFSRPVLVTSSIGIGNGNDNYIGNGNRRNSQSQPTYPVETADIFASSQKVGTAGSAYGRGRSLDVGFETDWKASTPSSFSRRVGQANDLASGNSKSQSQPVEGSYYEWRKIVSDCSVVCGAGIQEVIVQCVSGDTVVNDSLCQGRPRPGHSGYVNCQRRDCARSSSSPSSNGRDGKGSHLWNWIQSILPPKNTSYTNTGRTY